MRASRAGRKLLDVLEEDPSLGRGDVRLAQLVDGDGVELAGCVELAEADAGSTLEHDLNATALLAFDGYDGGEGADRMKVGPGLVDVTVAVRGDDDAAVAGEGFFDGLDRAGPADEERDDVAGKMTTFLSGSNG